MRPLLRFARALAEGLGKVTLLGLAVLLLGLLTLGSRLLPRLGRALRPYAKKVKKRARRTWRTAKLTPIRTAVAGGLLAIVGLNGAVRWTGGGPGWLAMDHLADKAVAVTRLVLHLPFHPFGTCEADRDDLLLAAAKAHGAPVELVRAVARTESGFRPHVISHAGAMGMMQLIPTTAVLMEVSDPFDARQSLAGGARYLGQLYRRYDGNLERTIAAYHAGPGAVPTSGPMRIGPQTRRYVRVVSGRMPSAPRAELSRRR